MKKQLIFTLLAASLAGCMGAYPAGGGTSGGMDNAAMVNGVMNVIGAGQSQGNGAQNYGNMPYQNNPQGGYAGQQPNYPAQGNQQGHFAGSPNPQGYGQNSTLAGVIGGMGGAGGMNVNAMLEGVIVNQCRGYINSQSMWQTAKMALGNQAGHWENQICQCASQETMRQMTAEQLGQLAMGMSGGQGGMSQTAINLIGRSASNCLQRLSMQGMGMR